MRKQTQRYEVSSHDLLSKLVAETERLRRDVLHLADRIEPYEHEDPPYLKADFMPMPIKTNEEVVRALYIVRQGILSCEHHLSAVRGRMDEIASDAIPRDELKQWIRRPPKK